MWLYRHSFSLALLLSCFYPARHIYLQIAFSEIQSHASLTKFALQICHNEIWPETQFIRLEGWMTSAKKKKKGSIAFTTCFLFSAWVGCIAGTLAARTGLCFPAMQPQPQDRCNDESMIEKKRCFDRKMTKRAHATSVKKLRTFQLKRWVTD